MIADAVLEQILSRTDIVELIGGYLPLRPAGKYHKGLCPFHTEKTPSFVVNAERQIFHCFGCGEGGDAIAFLMKHERFTFPEAIRYLADRVGVTIPTRSVSAGQGGAEGRLRLYEVQRLTLDYFRQELGSPEGGVARQYLADRGIDEGIQERFQLGFAPARWDGLLRALKRQGVPEALLERAGLVVPRAPKGGPAGPGGAGYYDRFRGRVMIPIWDVGGKVVAFGGRALPGAAAHRTDGTGEGAGLEAAAPGEPRVEAKYINSPETPIYRKGTHLYALNMAAKAIREQGWAIVVEGYFDCIALHRFGFANAVASLGTALTPEQVGLLARYVDRVVLAFDPDRAGVQAALRGIDLVIGAGMGAEVALLPEGEDPDSLLQRRGAAALEEAFRNGVDVVDFVWRAAGRRTRGIDGAAQVAEAILPLLARMERGIPRARYLQKLADRLGVPEATLVREMERLQGAPASSRGAGARGAAPAVSPGAPSSAGPEVELLRALILRPDLHTRLRTALPPEAVADPVLRQIYTVALEAAPRGPEAVNRALGSQQDDAVRREAAALLVEDAGAFGDPVRIAEDCLRRLRQRAERVRRVDLIRQIKAAEAAGDVETLRALLAAYPSAQGEGSAEGGSARLGGSPGREEHTG